MRFKVALLQIAPHGHDQNKNLARGLNACRKAKELGADLVVFPELWNIGSAQTLALEKAGQALWNASAIDQRSTFFRGFCDLARELQMNIAITYLEAFHPRPRNTVSILNSRGDVVLNYSKVCICDFPAEGGNESGCDLHCSPGESFPVCTVRGADGEVQVGAMICADREFPEPATQLMLNGAELVIVPNACDWDEVRSAALLTRAWENLVAVATANYPLPLNNGNSRAYSCVLQKNDQACSPVAVADEGEQILIAEFNFEEIREFRRAEAWRLVHRYRAAVLDSRM